MSDALPTVKKIPIQERLRIANSIVEKTNDAPCPMCKCQEWAMTESYTFLIAGHTPRDFVLDKGLPAAVAICRNCGFVALYALAMHGLMPAPVPTQPEPSRGEKDK